MLSIYKVGKLAIKYVKKLETANLFNFLLVRCIIQLAYLILSQ